MAEDVLNFDIAVDSDSDDSIFLTQLPSQARRDADLNQSIDEIDLENLLNSTKNSAFDGDSSFKKILSKQNVTDHFKPGEGIGGGRSDAYRPEVEDISSEE